MVSLSTCTASYLWVPLYCADLDPEFFFQVMKQLWEYIRANNLQDPANKRNIIVDKKLGTLFKAPLDMFNINKQITPHFPKGQ